MNDYLDKPLLICKKCLKDKHDIPWGFATYRGFYNMFKIPDDMKCKECGSILEKTKLNCNEYDELNKISHDIDFLMSMISLKEKDPIEYQLKLSQFKAAVGQQEQARVAREESNKVRCPKCGSTQITTGARGVNHFWGFIGASKTVNRCGNCGHTWTPR